MAEAFEHGGEIDVASGDDMDRAINVLQTGATLPAESSSLLADLIEAQITISVGLNPPTGWLSADMKSLDVARCLLAERGHAVSDQRQAISMLREGTALPAESSPALAALLQQYRVMEWSADASDGWLAVGAAAQAVARAVVQGMLQR
ncbi:hypothetical protein [Saccharopolyspora elongata]|uniref:Uncharacterized protein n=1 Tax=Saccharopolyspora elongata TaxID=2530387 RepID=A0A4R4YUF6_9PSEU|nr:hypothetical protein [Saccharopolyspora elongata]TDD49008.1 hypothetical protein E1288_21045 [Saccharopolyspora elongata]